jgi:hypothetical protein
MTDIARKRAAFRKLHESGCFVIPNPWDVGSARYLAHLGFKALASTSAGVAFSRGVPDTAVGRDGILAHLAELAAATDLPVNADFENGSRTILRASAESVRLCAQAGVADCRSRIRPAMQRHRCTTLRMRSRESGRHARHSTPTPCSSGAPKGFLVGRPDLDDVIQRLRAYSEAGADCLYAPGLRTREHIAAVVAGRCAETGERARQLADRLVGRRSRGIGGAAHFSGRRARAGRMGRLHPRRDRDRRARHVRSAWQRRAARALQKLFAI